MFEGVGRRRDQTEGRMLDLGEHGLNGREHKCLFRNNGDGTFTDVAHVNAADLIEDGRGLSLFDYDRDGQVDMLLRNYRQPAQLLHNAGGPQHWIEFKLIGTRSNRDAVGARVTVRVGRATYAAERTAGGSYLASSDPRVHLGLGRAAGAAEVRVRWPSPSDRETVLRDVPAGEVEIVEEE